MKKKIDLLAFLGRNWFYYVLWLIIAVFAWEWVFAYLTKPKEEESVYLFFGVENVLTDEAHSALDSKKPEYVRNLDITFYSTRSDSFDVLFATRIQTEADVFVLPEEYCEPSAMRYLFYPMDLSEVKEIFGEDAECGAAVCEDKAYGVKIYDKETGVGKAANYLTYTYLDENGEKKAVGDYYLFFNKKSLHLGKLSKSELDGALVLASAIWNDKAE